MDEGAAENTVLLSKIKQWCFGNGTTGAAEKLENLETDYHETKAGDKECQPMKEIKKHIDWHEKDKHFKWAVLIPVYISLAATVASVIVVFTALA